MTVAVIPARGGSQGVLRKNLRTVGGVPLVVRSIRAAEEAGSVDRVIVSTDDPEIAAVARHAGAEVHVRPDHLAGPGVPVAQVVAAVLAGEDDPGFPVVVLQPTSPFTDCPLIDAVVAELAQADSVETVRPHHHAIYSPQGTPWHEREVNRQYADVTAWVPTGAVRAMTAFPAEGGPASGAPMVGDLHVLFDPSNDMPGCSPHQAERYALDVDTPADFHVARDLASRGKVTFVVTAGTDTGSGHLHRCLTLADELAHHDVGFDFLGEQAEWAVDMVRDRGHRLRHGLVGQGDGRAPDALVFDCLEQVTVPMVRASQAQGSRVAVLECLDPAVVEAADLTVNSLYDGPPGAVTGPAWEPLRPEFAQEGIDPRPGLTSDGPERLRVLVSFGGTDPSRLTERFVELVRLVPGADPVVLWPPGRPPQDAPQGVPIWDGSVSEALASADLAVTSAGRTVLEAAAMVCPTIAVCAHERETLHAAVPGVVWLGHHATVTDDAFRQAVSWLVEHPNERHQRAVRAYRSVDPSGAAVRLADLIDRMARG